MKFEGFLRIYRESAQEGENDLRDEEGRVLPEVSVGEILKLEELLREQKFTQPPPRYNEASLVKALEEKGIGRPSTYQQILSVIMTRDYVEKQKGRFAPTELGEIVNDLLIDHFEEIFDYDYTAKLETDLDEIEDGKENWIEALNEFYVGFKEKLQTARLEMKNLRREGEPTDEKCDQCGSAMVIRWGRFGRFMACSNFPACRHTREIPKSASEAGDPTSGDEVKDVCEKCGQPMVARKGRYGDFLACSGYPVCKNTKKIVREGGNCKTRAQPELNDQCPKCGARMVLKHGRYGEFAACSNYPECRYIKPDATGVKCPDCGEGEVVRRKSRRGRVFYACDRYPKCKLTLWQKPIPETCPLCGAPYLLEKVAAKKNRVKACSSRSCTFQENLDDAITADSAASQEESNQTAVEVSDPS
jgi:DNA topoisomerase-1